MNEPLPLGRDRIRSFLLCQRQFELRTIVRLPWPDLPLEAETEQAVAQGRAFHQLLERHFLGMDVSPTPGPETSWWQAFQAHPPALPESGRRLPEVRLTVPIGGHLLLARFDLLVVGTSAESTPFVHIFDWKTSRARSSAELRNDWQTRLYLAMVA